jgi:Kef-type K+ transport system membrane component KefB
MIVLAGLACPLLSAGRRRIVPVVVGELAAGIVIGVSGFGWLDPAEPTTAFLAEIGFAMLMFAAGMSVPLREPGLVTGLRRGGVTAAVAALLAVPFGFIASRATGTHHTAVYALLLASGSAALLLPALKEHGLMGDQRALTVMAQVALADIATIVALPLVLQPGHALRAALGGLLVAACILLLYGATRLLHGRPWVGEVRGWSKKRNWALDLRLSLLVLFGLVWVAQRSGTSALIAGFGAGLMVAAIGGPKRLSRQVAGVATGFMVPIFFVVLGARLDVRALWQHPSLLVLAGLLLATNAFVHVCAALLTRQSLGAGFAATAQLGVPAAVVTLGLQENVLTSGEGSAIIAAALGSLALTAAGVTLLGRSRRAAEPSPETGS